MPEGFPRMNVGEMHFHSGHSCRGDGVPQGNAGVGERSSVEKDAIELLPRIMNPADQLSFMVGLLAFQDDLSGGGFLLECLVDLLHGNRAINGRLPEPQHVQVGAMQAENIHQIFLTSSRGAVDAVMPSEAELLLAFAAGLAPNGVCPPGRRQSAHRRRYRI
jgi:hypothetical protein